MPAGNYGQMANIDGGAAVPMNYHGGGAMPQSGVPQNFGAPGYAGQNMEVCPTAMSSVCRPSKDFGTTNKEFSSQCGSASPKSGL